jgi:uncharacterized membrane protein YphA (DoxX/SURF4 family)
MTDSKTKRIASWGIQILLAALFALAALGKLTRNPQWISRFRGYGYSAGFCVLIGALEGAGALGLLIPRIARYAAIGLLGIMSGALYTHLVNHEAPQAWRPLIFMVLLAIVISCRRPWPRKRQELVS